MKKIIRQIDLLILKYSTRYLLWKVDRKLKKTLKKQRLNCEKT